VQDFFGRDGSTLIVVTEFCESDKLSNAIPRGKGSPTGDGEHSVTGEGNAGPDGVGGAGPGQGSPIVSRKSCINALVSLAKTDTSFIGSVCSKLCAWGNDAAT
jgi:hypothetical protein